jgi:hypothetical protein
VFGRPDIDRDVEQSPLSAGALDEVQDLVDASGGSADRGSRVSPVKLFRARGPYQFTLPRSNSFEDRPTRLPGAYESNPFGDPGRPVEISRTDMQ